MSDHLLLLHGALGSIRQVNPLIPVLEKSVRPLLMNFEGHGGQDPRKVNFRMETFTRQLLEYLEKEDLSKVVIFGYSMGGYVALNAALQTDRIFGIITLGTKFDWTPETAAQEIRMLNPEKIEEKVPAFAAMLADRHGEEHWKEVVRRTADLLADLGTHPPLTVDRLKQISVPVVIGLGDKDNMVSREESITTAAHLPAGSFEQLMDTPHPFEQTDKERISRYLLGALAKMQ